MGIHSDLVDLIYIELDWCSRICLSLTSQAFLRRYPIPIWARGTELLNEALLADHLGCIFEFFPHQPITIDPSSFHGPDCLNYYYEECSDNYIADYAREEVVIKWLLKYRLKIKLGATQLERLALRRCSLNDLARLLILASKWAKLSYPGRSLDGCSLALSLGYFIDPIKTIWEAACDGDLATIYWAWQRLTSPPSYDWLAKVLLVAGSIPLVDFIIAAAPNFLNHRINWITGNNQEMTRPGRGDLKFYQHLDRLGINYAARSYWQLESAVKYLRFDVLEAKRRDYPLKTLWNIAYLAGSLSVLKWLLDWPNGEVDTPTTWEIDRKLEDWLRDHNLEVTASPSNAIRRRAIPALRLIRDLPEQYRCWWNYDRPLALRVISAHVSL